MADENKLLARLDDLCQRVDLIADLLSAAQPGVGSGRKLLTVGEVVAEYNIPRASVYRLPPYCIARRGRSVRVWREKLERYLARRDGGGSS